TADQLAFERESVECEVGIAQPHASRGVDRLLRVGDSDFDQARLGLVRDTADDSLEHEWKAEPGGQIAERLRGRDEVRCEYRDTVRAQFRPGSGLGDHPALGSGINRLATTRGG